MTVKHKINKLIKPANGNMLDEVQTYHDNKNHIINFICEMP